MTKQTKADLQQELTAKTEALKIANDDYKKLVTKYNSLKGKTDMVSSNETILTRTINLIDETNRDIAKDLQDPEYNDPPKALKCAVLIAIIHLVALVGLGFLTLLIMYPAFGWGVFLTTDVYCMIRYFTYLNTMDYSNAKTE